MKNNDLFEKQLNELTTYENYKFDVCVMCYNIFVKNTMSYVEREIILSERTKEEVLQFTSMLEKLNNEGWNIYIRTSYCLINNFFTIDDIKKHDLDKVITILNTKLQYQCEVLSVIETSEDNLQINFYTKENIAPFEKSHIINQLLHELSTQDCYFDVNCTDTIKFFRAAGFINNKNKHIEQNFISHTINFK